MIRRLLGTSSSGGGGEGASPAEGRVEELSEFAGLLICCPDFSHSLEGLLGVDSRRLYIVQSPCCALTASSRACVRFGVTEYGLRQVVVLGHDECSILESYDGSKSDSRLLDGLVPGFLHLVEGAREMQGSRSECLARLMVVDTARTIHSARYWADSDVDPGELEVLAAILSPSSREIVVEWDSAG